MVDGKVDVVKKASGNNNDDVRERHVGGRQRQRVSQRRRLEQRGWHELRGVLTALNLNKSGLSYRLHDGI
jgi:hypothetical protein